MRRIHIRCVVDTGSTYREPIAIVIELNCVSKPNMYNLIYMYKIYYLLK